MPRRSGEAAEAGLSCPSSSPLALFSKKRNHYLTISYKDDAGKDTRNRIGVTGALLT